MKKYLKDLEAELNKLNISAEEIAEILQDHKEMLEEAVAEGLSDDEIALKFGDPEKLAKDLHEDVFEEKLNKKHESVFGTEKLQGYELVNSFQTLGDLNSVKISLISEDVVYFPYDGEEIEVYVRGKFREEDYSMNFKDGEFYFKRSRNKNGLNIFGKKSPDFGIRVPRKELELFNVSLVSGNGEAEDIHAEKVNLKTVSGDLKIISLTTSDTLSVSVVSGDVKLEKVIAKGFEISMVSGDLKLNQAKFDEAIHIGTVSGDANVKDMKCPGLSINTVSGDFNGKEVYCESVSLKSISGDVNIKNSNTDIEIQIKDKKSLSGKVTIN